MDVSSDYIDILDDETLAPLKRNHACLQVHTDTRPRPYSSDGSAKSAK